MEAGDEFGTDCEKSDATTTTDEDDDDNESEEEEEKIWLKPPDPCLLCGEPAVHYDAEGNVIKRETSSSSSPSRLHSDSEGNNYYSSFFACIFKCFRVEGNHYWRSKTKWTTTEEGPRPPLPICESCEELVDLLLQMYDKVEELENKIRMITTQAEEKAFEAEDLYKREDTGEFYASFRGSLNLVPRGNPPTNESGGVGKSSVQETPVPKMVINLNLITRKGNKPESRSPSPLIKRVADVAVAASKTPKQNAALDDDFDDVLSDSSTENTINYSDEKSNNKPTQGDTTGDADADADIVDTPTRALRNRQAIRKKYTELSSESDDEDDGGDGGGRSNISDSDFNPEEMEADVNDKSSSEAHPAHNMEQAGEGHHTTTTTTTSSKAKSATTGVGRRRKRKLAGAPYKSKDFPFQCPKCPWSFKTWKGVQMHHTQCHRQDPPTRVHRLVATCRFPTCRRTFPTKAQRHAHYCHDHPNTKEAAAARPAHKSARCLYPGCTSAFPDDPTLQSHVSQEHHHSSNSTTSTSTSTVGSGCMCPLCGKVLTTQSGLTRHALMHSEEKRHRCPRCPSSAFRTKRLLNNHLAAVHGEGPTSGHFRCEQPGCNGRREYQSRIQYYKHMRVIHKMIVSGNNVKMGRPKTTSTSNGPPAPPSSRPRPPSSKRKMTVNQCPTCGKFIARGSAGLRRHELTHQPVEEKKSRFLCPTCGAGFARKHSLEMHILGKHPDAGEGKQLFRCRHCRRQYKTESSLAAHLERAGEGHSAFKSKSASGEGRWKVQSSSSTSTKSSSSSSKKDFPFQCPKCPWSFRSWKGVLLHDALKHRLGPRAKKKRVAGLAAGPLSGHFTCEQPGCFDCDGIRRREFKSRTTYYKHMRLVHKIILTGNVRRGRKPKTKSASNDEPSPPPPPETTIISNNDFTQETTEASSSNKTEMMEVATETDAAAAAAAHASTQFLRTGKGKRRRRPRKDKTKERVHTDDRICRVDSQTGNILYSTLAPIPRSKGCSPHNVNVNVNLEFVKQSHTSYKCAQCSRTVSFQEDGEKGIIDRAALLAHVRRFHPSGRRSGLCPVCEMPVASVSNSAYYEHRLTHLSEEERAAALANPRSRWVNGKPYFIAPSLPPVEKKRQLVITPALASLRGDVSQCPSCGKFVTGGPQGLERHELTHLPPEEKKTFLCATCGLGFTVKYSLDMHVLRAHPSDEAKLYKCPKCPRECKTEESLRIHMEKEGPDHTANIPRPRRRRRLPQAGFGNGDGEEEEEEEELRFPCSKCPRSFSTQRGLLMHNIHNHRGLKRAKRVQGVYSCRLHHCRQRFASKEERQAHYSKAHPNTKEAVEARPADKAVTCNYPSCGQAFPDEFHLQGHVSTEHDGGGGGGSMCSLCGRVLVNDWSLSQHALIHSKEKAHGCPRCPATFRTKPLLHCHLAAVHGEGPISGHFKCEQPGCDKEYKSRNQYYQHMRQVHNLIASAKGKQQQRMKGKDDDYLRL